MDHAMRKEALRAAQENIEAAEGMLRRGNLGFAQSCINMARQYHTLVVRSDEMEGCGEEPLEQGEPKVL